MNGDVLVQIGPLRLYALGTALAVSVLAGMAVALPEGRRRGIPQSAVLSAAASAMLGGWVGGRLAPSLLSLAAGGEWSWQSGELSYYGGLLAGTAGACWAARRAGVRAWRMLDAAAPALPFGLAVAAALLTRPSLWPMGCRCWAEPRRAHIWSSPGRFPSPTRSGGGGPVCGRRAGSF